MTDFNEGDHPRDDQGRFTDGAGGGGKPGQKSKGGFARSLGYGNNKPSVISGPVAPVPPVGGTQPPVGSRKQVERKQAQRAREAVKAGKDFQPGHQVTTTTGLRYTLERQRTKTSWWARAANSGKLTWIYNNAVSVNHGY